MHWARASECEEVGMGLSAHRRGKRISSVQAEEILELFVSVPHYRNDGLRHFEEIQWKGCTSASWAMRRRSHHAAKRRVAFVASISGHVSDRKHARSLEAQVVKQAASIRALEAVAIPQTDRKSLETCVAWSS